MKKHVNYFVVADRLKNETIFYKVPFILRSYYDIYRANRKHNYSFTDFKTVAKDWFEGFPQALEVLNRVEPVIVVKDWGFRLPGYTSCVSTN